MAARDILGVLRPAAPVSGAGLYPVEQPLTWPRWDDGELRLSVVNQDGSPVNVTGWQFVWTVRERNDGGTGSPLLSRSGAITAAASGRVSFGLGLADWTAFVEHKSYRHDVVGVDGSGNRHQLVPQSALTILPAVGQPGDVPTLPPGSTPLPYPVASVAGEDGIAVDNLDARNPVVRIDGWDAVGSGQLLARSGSAIVGVTASPPVSLLGEHGIAVDNASPLNPIVRLGWEGLVGDNQLLARSGNGLSGIPKAAADWALTTCRYFLVDNEGGSDSNAGYVDAPPNTTIDPTGKAIKTVDKLWQIFPRDLAGRYAVILLKGRSSGTYLNAAAATVPLLAHGISGQYRLVIRGSTDLTNSPADQLTCGGRTAPGCNAAGYNIARASVTISAIANTTPLAVTTQTPHGLTTGDAAIIAGVVGLTAANGEYTVTVTGPSSLTLDSTRAVFGQTYTSGGTVVTYRWTQVGGGAAALPVFNDAVGRRIRFDAATATTSLRNTCYEILEMGNDTIVPARAFVAEPVAGDVVYLEEPGAQFTRIEYSGQGAVSLAGLGSLANTYAVGATGIVGASNLSIGSIYIAFCSSVNITGAFGFSQAFISNIYANEGDVQLQIGGCRAQGFTARFIGLFSQLRCMAFGTSGSPNIYYGINQIGSFHSSHTNRGMDFVNVGTGAASIPAASFSGDAVGRTGLSTAKRNRIGSSSHGGGINVVRSNIALYGNFFRGGSTSPLIFVVGSGGSVVIDDCIGSATGDVAGVDLSLSAYHVRVTMGATAANSIGGSGGKTVTMFGGGIVSIDDLAQGHAADARHNVVLGAGGMGYVRAAQGSWADFPSVSADPSGNPAAGKVRVWFRSDTKELKLRDSAGVVSKVTLT